MTKWIASIIGALFLSLAGYSASALISLERLAAAARASDGAEVIARTNVPRVRQAIIGQVISAYLEKVGQKRPVRPFERMAIETFGASIADDLAIKLVTADNLSALLRSGAVRESAAKPELGTMPALGDLDVSNIMKVLRRVKLIKPVEFELQLGDSPSAGSISMHFEAWGWKLSSINLPASIVARLVERLPVR
jgi:hypothetical protein